MLGPLRGVPWLLRRLRHERAGCSSGREWLLPPEGTAHGAALGLGCCAVVAQRGHHCCRSEWCKQACNTRLSARLSKNILSLITWVKQLLHGMRLGCKKPAKCLQELHSPEQQYANTHRLFIKLCWLMDKHAVSADRVVNIDETSCRLLPVHQTSA